MFKLILVSDVGNFESIVFENDAYCYDSLFVFK